MQPIPIEIRAQVLAACDAGEGTRVVAVRFNVSRRYLFLNASRSRGGQEHSEQRSHSLR